MAKRETALWIAALLGMVVFAAYVWAQSIFGRIEVAAQAEIALQALDVLREPMIAVELTELEHSVDLAADTTTLPRAADRIERHVENFQFRSAYNPALSALAGEFAANAADWMAKERTLWRNHRGTPTDITTSENAADRGRHRTAMKSLFLALQTLGAAERVIHADTRDGRTAVRELQISGALLIAYFFSLIILIQRRRHRDLAISYRTLGAANQRTAEREQQLALTLDSIGDAVIATDGQGYVTRLNPVAEVLTGWRTGEALGKPLEKVFDIINAITRDPANNPVKKVLMTGKIVGLANHTVLISRDGTEYQIADSGAPIKTPEGEIIGVILVFRDVTDEYKMQAEIREHRDHLEELIELRTAELEQANQKLFLANRELESFCYTVSHDLRAPLRAIAGFSEVLTEDHRDGLNDEALACHTRICANVKKMNNLIEDTLNLSKSTHQNFHRTDTNLSQLFDQSFATLREQQPDRSVDVLIEPNITVSGDRKLLQIAIDNLAGNAWKYTGLNEKAKIEFKRCRMNDEAVFVLRDNGVGFDMNQAEALFEAFQRLHGSQFEGSGVGLATVDRIIQRHNGKIWAESKQDEGASFYFTLGESTQ